MTHNEVQAQRLATGLYEALACGDRARLDELLHPEFEGKTTDGLPLGLGGTYHGPDEMRRNFWGGIAKSFLAQAEPNEFTLLDDGRLVVFGRYTGSAREGGKLDAQFTHVLSFADGRIVGLVQLTDSARWQQALEPKSGLRTIEFEVDDGIAVLRLNRPHLYNAINPDMADELYEVAQRCAARSDLRVLVVLGNGSAFTVGGDISVFAATESDELPKILRRMTTPYHEALRIFSELPVPVVTAVHGSVAGGGLGLLYVADIALAAEGTRFATGFTTLGLSGDGANSWFLPRLVGLRRAQELYLRRRPIEAAQALEWGLVAEVVPAAELVDAAMTAARGLAAGPTAAYSEIRRLLRESWTSSLAEQLTAEIEALARTAATDDAWRAMRSFIDKTTPTFEGR